MSTQKATKMKTDYLGKELHIGDTVIFILTGYTVFRKGIIIKMTNLKVTIQSQYLANGTTCRLFNQVIKIT